MSKKELKQIENSIVICEIEMTLNQCDISYLQKENRYLLQRAHDLNVIHYLHTGKFLIQ